MLSSSISSIMTVMPFYLVLLQVEESSRAVGITQRELLRTWRGRTHTLQWQNSRKMQLRSTFRFGTAVTIIWNACIYFSMETLHLICHLWVVQSCCGIVSTLEAAVPSFSAFCCLISILLYRVICREWLHNIQIILAVKHTQRTLKHTTCMVTINFPLATHVISARA